MQSKDLDVTSFSRLSAALIALLAGPGLAHAAGRDANPAHEAPAPGIDELIVKNAHDYGVPVSLAKAIVHIESRGNPRARNHGALGLMQIKAETARRLGFDGVAAGLLTPDTNLHYGMQYLAGAYRASGGDVCRTLAFYQTGHLPRRTSTAARSSCSRARALMARA